VPRKKQNTPKQTPAKKGSAAAGRKSDAKTSPAASTTPGADADAENKQANGGNTNSSTGSGCGNSAATTPTPGSTHKKRKRTTTTGANNNNNSMSNSNSATNINSNASSAQGAAIGGNSSTCGQKKHAQRSQQAAQEDDEEECRAENCHKPTGREVDWVQCDGGCNEWFHMYCVGLNRNQIKADDDYICIRCTKTVAIGTPGSVNSMGATSTTPGKQTVVQSAR